MGRKKLYETPEAKAEAVRQNQRNSYQRHAEARKQKSIAYYYEHVNEI